MNTWYRWLLNDNAMYDDLPDHDKQLVDPFRLSVFVAMHLACLGVFITGFSWFALGLASLLYILRMFFITAFYHRYFAHKTFKVSRGIQFLMALAGCTAGQRGPLWWASHHRYHHINSDTDKDPHSPKNGKLDSHMLWFLRRGNFAIQRHCIRDFMKYPELVLLEKLDWLPFLGLAIACYAVGAIAQAGYPDLNTGGLQSLIWGFFISTVFLYHATYTINSLAHYFGSRRFDTNDNSRNNIFLALLTLGEGWHNNHHRYPLSTRQGFYWWEIDISYQLLMMMSKLGLIREMRPVPVHILNEVQRRGPI